MSVECSLADDGLLLVFSTSDIKIEYTTNIRYTRAFWENWLEELTKSENDYIYLGLDTREKTLSTGLARKTFAIPFTNCIKNVILADSKFLQEEIDYHFSDDES